MNIIDLKRNLDLLNVDPKQYSLNGELNLDAIVLFQNYNKWEVFYIDERGERNNEKNFTSENNACEYIYNLFKDAKAIEKKYGLKTQRRAAKGGTQGGLNLFKWGEKTTITANGWRTGDRMLHLPNKGTPQLNWKQNAGFLRQEMRTGNPIYDSFRYTNGEQIPTGGFLRAERYLLESRGWKFNSATGAYHSPY